MKSHWVTTGTSAHGFDWGIEQAAAPAAPRRVEAVFGEPNFKAIWWLESALHASRSVARVKMPAGSATGFLVAPGILITNNHVFETKQDAQNARIQFNYRLLANGDMAERDEWECDPDDLFTTNVELDYSLVRIKPKNGKIPGEVWQHLRLSHGESVNVNQRVNIIQHPQGRFQEIAFRDNQVQHVGDHSLQYVTDTDYGTSGSPVFDDWFNVVALHSQRVPDPNNPGHWFRNQGTRVESILADAGNLLQ